MLACDDRMIADGRLARVFPSIVEAVLANHMALPAGQVLGPFGAVMTEICSTEWLLCEEPRPFPQAFAVCAETASPTHFVWLVPISAGEADEIGHGRLAEVEQGWELHGVDPLDWQRFRSGQG